MEKRDIRECKVSVNRKLKEIELLEKPVEFLDEHFYAKVIENTRDFSHEYSR